MGNLYSVQEAFKRLERPLKIIKSPNDLKDCDALILPGVGAFDPAMENLEKTKLVPYLKKWAENQKPLLGICLGLQLLFESSEEGSKEGLGIIQGKVSLLPKNESERIPHMGWANLIQKNQCPLTESLETNNWMYFVHSYAAITQSPQDLAASVNFGQTEITAIVWKGNIGACQFHPEKSSQAGERLLLRWIHWLENRITKQK
tara:strand:+ start:214 stop:822 length:609 start_codon:yes stop_codon:yes gene_type:complete